MLSKNERKHIKVLQEKNVTYLQLLADIQQQETKLLGEQKEYCKSFPSSEQQGSYIESDQQSVEFVEEVLNNDEMGKCDDIC